MSHISRGVPGSQQNSERMNHDVLDDILWLKKV